MIRPAVVLVLLLASGARAATITSGSCGAGVYTGCVTSYVPNSHAVAVQVSGTWVGTLVWEGSNDNATFTALRAYPVAGGAFVTSTTTGGAWTVPTGGLLYVRTRASAWTSGSATVLVAATSAAIVADVVRATGPEFGAVDVEAIRSPVTLAEGTTVVVEGSDGGSPTFGLSQGDIDQIVAPQCAVVTPQHNVVLDGGAHAFPPLLADGGTAGELNRTGLTVANFEKNHYLSCDLAETDGGLPSCTVPGLGRRVYPESERTWLAPAAATIWCRCCAASCSAGYAEEVCR